MRDVEYKCDHTLIIVESPSKCPTIENILFCNPTTTASYKVIATRGHFFEIKGLAAINKNFEANYSIIESQIEHTKLLKAEVARAGGGVILATDSDREGESIAFNICTLCGLDPLVVPRIAFHEITENAILHAISHPRTINMNLVYAAQTRAVLDLLVGYKLSPLLWKYVPVENASKLSAGRCQTPAINLIADVQTERESNLSKIESRDSEQEIFVYKVGARFQVSSHIFQTELKNTILKTSESTCDFFTSASKFEHLLMPDSLEISNRIVEAPQPFSTISLIQTAASVLHFTTKQTMEIAQALYQAGIITYHRTDSSNLSDTFRTNAKKYLTREFGSASISEDTIPTINGLNSKAHAHEGIRPTNPNPTKITLLPNAKKLYDLIRTRALQSCMKSAFFKGYILETQTADGAVFQTTIQHSTNLGWKLLEKQSQQEKTNNKMNQSLVNYLEILQNSANQKQVVLMLVNLDAHQSISPEFAIAPLLSEHELIQKMENLKIGRPSTFVAIMDTLYKREYVSKKNVPGVEFSCKNISYKAGDNAPTIIESVRVFGQEKSKLWVTPLGSRVLNFLLRNFEGLFEYNYTATMEKRLDEIANGDNILAQQMAKDLCKECDDFIKQESSRLKPKQSFALKDSPNFELVFGKSGPVIVEHILNEKGTKTGETKFKNIRLDLQLDFIKLNEKEYTLDELLPVQTSIGTYQNFPLFLKHGKFGYFVQFGDTKISLKNMNFPPGKSSHDDLSLSDIVFFLEAPSIKDPKLLRYISPVLAVYSGKYGAYIRYSKSTSRKPIMKSLNKFHAVGGFLHCDVKLLEEFIF